MTAEANLAGLFPPQGSQVWNDELLWQPVPVHTVPVDTDYVSNLEATAWYAGSPEVFLWK